MVGPSIVMPLHAHFDTLNHAVVNDAMRFIFLGSNSLDYVIPAR